MSYSKLKIVADNIDKMKIVFPNLLKEFNIEYCADDDLLILFQNAQKIPAEVDVDFFLIEQNIADVSTLLERLLGYRKELVLIDAERIRTAIGYSNAIDIAHAEAEIELLRQDNPTEQLKAAVERRVQAVRNYVEFLEARHSKSGSSLNYWQRMEKIKALANRDVTSLVPRARAISEYCSRFAKARIDPTNRGSIPRFPVTEGQLTLAIFDGAGFLDELVAWHRIIARAVESASVSDRRIERTISLCRHMWYDHWIKDQYGYSMPLRESSEVQIDGNIIDELKKGVKVELSLGNELPAFPGDIEERFESERLRSIAISVGMPVDQQNWSFEIRLTIPEVTKPLHLTANVFPDINWVSDKSLFNRSLSSNYRGNWYLEIIGAACGHCAAQSKPDQWPINDIKLHLRTISNRD
jgi:hypothetical protein